MPTKIGYIVGFVCTICIVVFLLITVYMTGNNPCTNSSFNMPYAETLLSTEQCSKTDKHSIPAADDNINKIEDRDKIKTIENATTQYEVATNSRIFQFRNSVREFEMNLYTKNKTDLDISVYNGDGHLLHHFKQENNSVRITNVGTVIENVFESDKSLKFIVFTLNQAHIQINGKSVYEHVNDTYSVQYIKLNNANVKAISLPSWKA